MLKLQLPQAGLVQGAGAGAGYCSRVGRGEAGAALLASLVGRWGNAADPGPTLREAPA